VGKLNDGGSGIGSCLICCRAKSDMDVIVGCLLLLKKQK
jgi:hypothetical protein